MGSLYPQTIATQAISKIRVDKELATRIGHFGKAKVREKFT
jgi:hypothetical protein